MKLACDGGRADVVPWGQIAALALVLGLTLGGMTYLGAMAGEHSGYKKGWEDGFKDGTEACEVHVGRNQ